jgi:hypothetical protein
MKKLTFALVFVCLQPAAGSAHTRSVSYSTWELGEHGARVELRIPAIELTRFPAGPPEPADFSAHLRLFAGADACVAGEASQGTTAAAGWAIFRWTVSCAGPGPRSIRSDLLSEVASSHIHFARIAFADGETRERFLVRTDSVWQIDPPAAGTSSTERGIAAYVWLGVGHILSGSDHLAFVLALLLLAASLREVTTLVTGFTVGHSVTLGLAALGAVHPAAPAVEILIGFSIALVAAENVWLLDGRERVIPLTLAGSLVAAAIVARAGLGVLPWLAWLGLALFCVCHFGLLATDDRPSRLRAAVALTFGLVHGFAFAGVLMEVGLPTARMVPALLGFNAGVELGQLGIVILVWPLLAALARRQRSFHHRLVEAGSAAIFALGVFWIVGRNWG